MLPDGSQIGHTNSTQLLPATSRPPNPPLQEYVIKCGSHITKLLTVPSSNLCLWPSPHSPFSPATSPNFLVKERAKMNYNTGKKSSQLL